jgi:hypothetical protein
MATRMTHQIDRGLRQEGTVALTFVVCISDNVILKANLLSSPCLQSHSPHQVIAIQNAPSAAAGLDVGLARAKHELVVCLHQDVLLPVGWDRLVTNQYRIAERPGKRGRS